VPAFQGFPDDFLSFLADLARNNERSWFQANKRRYRDAVVAPMCAFIACMAEPLSRISPHYRADPRPNGGSLFRIYRDTRFSKDKSPYKTHAACHFRHLAGKDAHAPGFYAHFEPQGLFFGGGIWLPPPGHLAAIRTFIADNPAEWGRIRSAAAVLERGGVQGDGLVRPPRGFDPEHRHIEDLKRKSFFVMTEAGTDLAGDGGRLVAEVTAAFEAAASLNHFICDALELPF